MSRTDTDLHPRSHPEDRQEGCFNPDPNLECWTHVSAHSEAGGGPSPRALAVHGPSGDPGDDDGAGNPSPRMLESWEGSEGAHSPYGQEDAD